MAENILWTLTGYLMLMNIMGLAAMGVDKAKAKRHAWRIPEKRLFLISILGGSLGMWTGMYLFRHKTRHWYFVVGMPAIFILQVVTGRWLFHRLFW